MKELNIEARKENLDEVLSFVTAELELRDCPPKVCMQLEIAVEELFVNVASYAYPEGEVGMFTLSVDFPEENVVSIGFIDGGAPFDPLKKDDPDVTLSAEERGIGGLGIYMVKKSMDDMTYERKNDQNILVITKKFKD